MKTTTKLLMKKTLQFMSLPMKLSRIRPPKIRNPGQNPALQKLFFSLCQVQVFFVVICGLGLQLRAEDNGASYSVTTNPKNSFGFFVLHGSQPLVNVGFGEWGDKAAYNSGPQSKDTIADGKLSITGDAIFDKNHLAHAVTMAVSAPNAVTWKCDLSAGQTDVAYNLLALTWNFPDAKKGSVTLTDGSGVEKTLSLPLPEGNHENISKIVFQISGSDKIELSLGSPIYVVAHLGAIYLRLGGNGWNTPPEVLTAGSKKSFSFTLTLPGSVAMASSDHFIKPLADASWFTYSVNGLNQPPTSVIGMEDWLDKPAGKHGGVREIGDHFEFEDGTPVKFWGGVISYEANLAPAKSDADIMSAFWARYGVNSIRFTFPANAAWTGVGDKNDCTKYDPALLDKMDYFMAQLASHGIYYRIGATWSFDILPANKDQVLNYDELLNFVGLGGVKGPRTYNLINFASDIQDLLIQKVVNLLKHQNPYTQKTYAEDPAMCGLEFQNEDDIFWYSVDGAFKQCPTYAKKFTEQYAAWLKQRYGTQEGLKTAWAEAIAPDETIKAGNIKLQMFPVYNITTSKGGAKRRLLDNGLFLHQVQDQFYSKFVKAVRDAGYKGPITGGNWQAPEMLAHFYNLLSDAKVGQIDRHNYFGYVKNTCFQTMLSEQGSGLLSTGLQQVQGKPFGLSEWSEVYPDCYRAEAPPLMAAYGMGLLGWNALYQEQFQVCTQPPSSYAKGDALAVATPMATMVGYPPYGVWIANSPSQMGQYPLLTRMLYRGDVKEGDIISTRNVSESELEQGKFSFSENSQQEGDAKSFSGSVPPAALAAGRCLVHFTDQPTPPVLPDMSKYQQGSVVTSATRQLKWDSSDQGFFTINTAGTKGVIGFAAAKPQDLGDVTITSQTPFASILLTAADKNDTLEHGSSAILSAIARESNTGFTYSALDNTVFNNGTMPILLEPVQADIVIKNRKITAINVLDQNGARMDKTLPFKDGAFHIDTGKDKTIYYEIVFKSSN